MFVLPLLDQVCHVVKLYLPVNKLFQLFSYPGGMPNPVGNKREAWDLLPRHFQNLGTFTGTFRALGPSCWIFYLFICLSLVHPIISYSNPILKVWANMQGQSLFWKLCRGTILRQGNSVYIGIPLKKTTHVLFSTLLWLRILHAYLVKKLPSTGPVKCWAPTIKIKISMTPKNGLECWRCALRFLLGWAYVI